MVEGPTPKMLGARAGLLKAPLTHPPPRCDDEDVTSAKAKATSLQQCRWPPVTMCRGDSSGTDPAQPPCPRQWLPWAFLDAENN